MTYRPCWEDAPEWAQYLTHDKDGWFWWENEPVLKSNSLSGKGRYFADESLDDPGNYEIIEPKEVDPLVFERRPTASRRTVI